MGVPLDAKWLEILKASGWQTAAIAIACVIIYALVAAGVIPAFGGIVAAIAACAGIICALLTIMAMASAASRWIAALSERWLRRRAASKAVRDYIPHMSQREKEIIGWLLSKNEKMFTGAMDGGYAITLIAQKIVVPAVSRGQVVDMFAVPYVVPDHAWKVLEAHRQEFPTPAAADVRHPWRVPVF